MHSKEKKEEVRLYREQKVNIKENIRIGENSQDQQGTSTQWILIGEEGEIGYALCIERKSKKCREKAGEKNRGKKYNREISTQNILEVKESIWKRRIRKNVHQEAIELYNRVKRRICAKKEKSVFSVERGKRV